MKNTQFAVFSLPNEAMPDIDPIERITLIIKALDKATRDTDLTTRENVKIQYLALDRLQNDLLEREAAYQKVKTASLKAHRATLPKRLFQKAKRIIGMRQSAS